MTDNTKKTRVAVILDDDVIWGLPVWAVALPALESYGYDVAGLWVCPGRLGRLTGADVHLWYWRHFGLVDFCKLAAIGALRLGANCLGAMTGHSAGSFERLGKRHGVPVRRTNGPNTSMFRDWLVGEQIDILVIMVSHILKPEVLDLPKIGTINKHAALLPANRGIFPYFWAKKKGEPQGVSYHVVVPEIDGGALLVQHDVDSGYADSMFRFYDHVMAGYKDRLLEAMARLAANETIQARDGIAPSYHGLPDREDVAEFRRNGGQIATFRDILSQIRVPLYR